MSHRILLVDDEVPIQKSVGLLLRANGYTVDVAATGAEALQQTRDVGPDLIILDLGLPDLPGVDVCRTIRTTSTVPVVVLSAKGAEQDKVRALDCGADDYVTKPFGSDELIARVRAALRRGSTTPIAGAIRGRVTVGVFEIDYDRQHVRTGPRDVRLTPKEFALLELLVAAEGRVLTRQRLLKAIWGPHAGNQTQHLWVLVSQLRRKIEPDPSHPRHLVSEPWVGYRFDAEGRIG